MSVPTPPFAGFPGLGWEDICVCLKVKDPKVRMEVRAKVLGIPARGDAGIARPAVGQSGAAGLATHSGERR